MSGVLAPSDRGRRSCRHGSGHRVRAHDWVQIALAHRNPNVHTHTMLAPERLAAISWRKIGVLCELHDFAFDPRLREAISTPPIRSCSLTISDDDAQVRVVLTIACRSGSVGSMFGRHPWSSVVHAVALAAPVRGATPSWPAPTAWPNHSLTLSRRGSRGPFPAHALSYRLAPTTCIESDTFASITGTREPLEHVRPHRSQ